LERIKRQCDYNRRKYPHKAITVVVVVVVVCDTADSIGSFVIFLQPGMFVC